MTWERFHIAKLARWSRGGEEHVLVHVSWDDQRDCGCRFLEGCRLDNGEYSVRPMACPAHVEQGQRAMDVLAMIASDHMDDVVHLTWERILDAEIDGVILN